MGGTLDQLRGICRSDPEALDAIDRATQNAPHVHTGDVDNVNIRPVGNASATALRRLRKDRPELHAKVLAKELSPHAAMVEAGFRSKTVTIPLTVAGVLRAMKRLSKADQIDGYYVRVSAGNVCTVE
jgi:hypothetical protein